MIQECEKLVSIPLKAVHYLHKNVGLPRLGIDIPPLANICEPPHVTCCASNSCLRLVNVNYRSSNDSLQEHQHCLIVILGDSRFKVPSTPRRDGDTKKPGKHPGDASLGNTNINCQVEVQGDQVPPELRVCLEALI